MTNREAVLSIIGFDIPNDVLTKRAELVGFNLNAIYDPKKVKAVARFSVSLLSYTMQSPLSESEIDWSITNRSMDDLIKLRSLIMNEYGIEDTFSKPQIKARSWG